MAFEGLSTEPGDSPFLTLGEVLRYLRVNARTVYRLIGTGELPASRIGRQWRIRRSDFEQWLEAQRVGSPVAVRQDDRRHEGPRAPDEQIHAVTASDEESWIGRAPG
jgi:excisionase family DNA binding protein